MNFQLVTIDMEKWQEEQARKQHHIDTIVALCVISGEAVNKIALCWMDMEAREEIGEA